MAVPSFQTEFDFIVSKTDDEGKGGMMGWGW
jgi:hypothetical protein